MVERNYEFRMFVVVSFSPNHGAGTGAVVAMLIMTTSSRFFLN